MLRLSDVITDFLHAGWRQVFEHRGAVYLSPDPSHMSLVRAFSPHLLKHHGVPIVPGILALLNHSSLQDKSLAKAPNTVFVAGAHSANFESLREPIVYERRSADEWISRVELVLAQLPRTPEQLRRDISEKREVDGFPVSRLLVSPAFRK